MDHDRTPHRLLVLDDDATSAAIIAAVAEDSGAEVRTTQGPGEFFAQLEGWRPTHLCVDLVMPTNDGVQVIERLAAMRSRARIVIVSGVDPRVLESAHRVAAEHRLPVVGSLGKPLVPDRLREILAAHVPVPDPPSDLAAPAFPIGDIEAAFERGELAVWFQPQFDLASGMQIGCEVLARWLHPTAGAISPSIFVPMLEADGTVCRLTEAVVSRALCWFASIRRKPWAPPRLSINVSAHDLADPAWADRLIGACVRHGVPAGEVVIELTETTAMRDPRAVLAIATRLRLAGFALSLDDFGCGFSSLVQLARLPLSSVKIDRSFVLPMLHDATAHRIVESIIRLGHALGMTVLAEGIESEAVRVALRDLGCDAGQGYHYTSALAAEDFMRLCVTRSLSAPVASAREPSESPSRPGTTAPMSR